MLKQPKAPDRGTEERIRMLFEIWFAVASVGAINLIQRDPGPPEARITP